MAGNPCEEFFELNATNEKKVAELQKVEDAAAWQKLCASKYSPGIVLPEESIVRHITHPTFIQTETQKIKPTWFNDVTNRGFSSDRINHTTLAAVADRARRRADEWNAKNQDKEPRTFHSLGKLEVARLRGIERDGRPALGIYDTALEDNAAHADVCQLIPDSRQTERSVRYEMYDMAQQIFEVDGWSE